MRLTVGHSYELINAAIPQGTPGSPPRITINEITEHEGAFIITGGVHSFQSHPYIHGFVDLKAKSGVFVILPVEYLVITEIMVKLLKGQPLMLQGLITTDRPQPIVNWAERLGKLWYTPIGQQASVTEKQRRAKVVIDLYNAIRATERVPDWFLRDRQVQPEPMGV